MPSLKTLRTALVTVALTTAALTGVQTSTTALDGDSPIAHALLADGATPAQGTPASPALATTTDGNNPWD